MFLPILNLLSQVTKDDSCDSGFLIDAHYSFHLPAADLHERFGVSSAIGSALWYKTKNNWLFALDLNYEFGGNVKIEDSIFKHISTRDGYIIDGNGMYAEVFTYERGWHGYVKSGKIFSSSGINSNSGIFGVFGVGFLFHKIRIYNQDQVALQVSGDYKKGYDRLTGGVAFAQNIGYFNIGKHKAYNFYIALEVIEGLTKPLRNYQYDLMGPENTKIRIDILYGVRVSWMIPFLQQQSDGYIY